MKKSKRMLLLALSMVLVMAMAMGGIMTVNAAETTDSVATNNVYKIGLLDELKISKISGVGLTEWTGDLTRGEAAFLVAGLLQLDRARQESIFDDVSIDAYYAGAVASLYNEGIVLKSWGSKKFKPDEPIMYAEFVTMLCKALGYGGYAEAKGGYPTGYLAAAKQFKLTNGVKAMNSEGNIDKQYVPTILINALDAYYLRVTAIDQAGNETATKQGTVLEEYFDAYIYEGVLDEVGPYSMTNNFFAAYDQVAVDGIVFSNPGTPEDFKHLLGQRVKMYYRENNKGIYIYPEDENVVLTINCDDITDEATDYIEYTDADGRTKKAKIAFDRKLMYNGTKVASLNTFIPKLGYVRLVDRDGDNKFDLIDVTEYKVSKVKHIDSYNKVCSLEDGETINTDIEETYITVSDTKGKVLKPTAITKDAVVMYAKNDVIDAQYEICAVVICKTSVAGTITATGTDEVAIDGTYYEYTEEFFNEFVATNKVSFENGKSQTIYLDANGKVIYADGAVYNYRAAKYAVYLSSDQVKRGSAPKWEIELYTQDGVHAFLPMADTVKLNGIKYKSTDTEIQDFIADTTIVKTIIKYNLKDGEITEFITADDWGTTYKVWELGEGFNKFEYPGTIHYRNISGVGHFGNLYRVANDAYRFVVKYDAGGKLDEENSTVTTVRFQNDQNISGITLYDIDKTGTAHAFTANPNYDNIAGGSGSNNSALFLVTKVFNGSDAEGNEGMYVTGLMSGAEKMFFLKAENYADVGITFTTDGSGNPVMVNPTIQVGNALKIRTSGEYITGLMKDKKNAGSQFLYFTKQQLTDHDDLAAYNAYEASRPGVWATYTTFARVVYVEEGIAYLANANTAGAANSPMTAFSIATGGTVYKYDSTATDPKEMFNVVTWGDVRTSTNVTGNASELNGSTVLVNVHSWGIVDVIILD